LELTSTLRGEPAPTLLSLLDTTVTPGGARLLRAWLANPLRTRPVLEARHAAVAEILERSRFEPLRAQLRGFSDIERIAARIALEARERARSGIANLKVEFNRVHGFFIEVTQSQSAKVPDDYRRRQTMKNAERYITPELKAFEDKALSAQERALNRERSLFESLLADLIPAIPALQRAAGALAALDVLVNLAERAEALSLTRPMFSDDVGMA